MEDESGILSRLLADLENPPISECTLRELLSVSLTPPDELTPNLFDSMSRRNVPLGELVSSISSIMDSSSSISLSLLASNTYLSLLLYDNAPVFTLFTPIAFLSLLRAIRRCFKSARVNVNDGSGRKVGSGAHKGGKRKRGKGKGKEVMASEDAEEGGESELDVKDLFECLKKLEKVLGLVHLDRFPDSLKSLVQTVGEIPIMAMDLNFGGSHYDRVMDLCCRILKESLNVEHGDQAGTAAEVLKSLSLSILLHKSHARTFALGFVKDVIVGLGKECDGIKKALVNLPRHLSLKAPERSEQRALAVESIMEIVRAMEFNDQIGFQDYVLKMSQGKATLRLLAVDMILALLTTLEDPLGVNSGEGERNLWGLTCLEALVQRCSDVIAGIRARALSNLAQLVGFLSNCSKSKDVLREVMGFGNKGGQTLECGMNDILRKRCMDEKAAVRKASLLLISKLTALLGGAFNEQVLKTMGISCSDPLVSIRKAAMSALSEAFRAFSNEKVTSEWLLGVPRLITDNETSIQEECGNLFLELVLDRISRAGSRSSVHKGSLKNDSNMKDKNIEREDEMHFPEGILGLLKDMCNGEVMPWVKKICTSLGKKKRLKPQLAIALQNIIKTSESVWLSQKLPIEKWTAPPGAWFLLSEVSVFLPKAVDWEFLHHHWQLLGNCEKGSTVRGPTGQADIHGEEVLLQNDSIAWAGDRVFLLQTISNVSVELPQEPAADLAHNLLKRIRQFNMHPTEINAHVMALRTLCKQKALNPDEADILVKKWATKLISKALRVVEAYTSGSTEAEEVKRFVTPTVVANRKGEKSSTLSEAISALYTVGSVVIVCPSADLKTIIPVLHTIITSGKSDKRPKGLPGLVVPIKQTSPSLYIHAWLTMGKICLADGKLAKSYIPLFVQELENSDCAALRSNLVVMMADFCVRHTALVDCYISKITKCLRDPCELVRRQTFILLSRLLQRDYVKWRGVLFLRFLLSLVDDSEKIRQLADFLFGNILKAKAPLLAYNSFVEAIYVLNDCRSHSGHTDHKSSRSESLLFSIRGNDESSRAKRMHIYVSLLKQMAPEHLLATFAKVCAEILASASDGMLNIEDIGVQCALQDAFQILACKEIRISPNRGSSSDTAELEEEGAGDSGGASSLAARGKVITQAIKKGLIQNTIPIFIELKRLLESKNSRLIGSLMECLRVLLKDYKNEIDEILVADKQLQKELIYDMQKYETDKAKSAAAEAISRASIAKSPRTSIAKSPRTSFAKSPRANVAKSPNSTAANAKSPKSVVNSRSSFEKSMHQNSTFRPTASTHSESSLQSNSKAAAAMADAAAAATARSILKEVNRGAMTPPLSAISVPKLKSTVGGISARIDRPDQVIASLRRRQNFDSDEEI